MSRSILVGSRTVARALAGALYAPLVLSGCAAQQISGGDDDAAADDPARIRVLNVAADGATFEVDADGADMATLDAMTGTDYADMPAGRHELDVFTDGAAAMSMAGEMTAGRSYTGILLGGSTGYRGLMVEDHHGGVLAGHVRVRVINGLGREASVDVRYAAPTSRDANGGFALMCTGVATGTAAEPDTIPVGSGTLAIDTTGDGDPEAVFDTSELAEGDMDNLIIVEPSPGEIGLMIQHPDGSLIILEPLPGLPGIASIRVLHLSPDAPPVDVFLGPGPAAIGGLPFGEVTGYAQVTAAIYDIDVAPAGGSLQDSVLSVPGLGLQANKLYTAVAFDRLQSIQALALEDDASSPGAALRLRIAHTAVGVGQVDVFVVGAPTDTVLARDLDFGAVTNPLLVPAGAYSVGIDVDDDAVAELIFDLPALPEGLSATIFAVADADGNITLRALTADALLTFDPRPTPPARVRVLHLSPDAPHVDVYADGIGVVSDLAFLTDTAFLDVAAAPTTFDIAPAGTSLAASVLTIANLPLVPGRSYTTVAFGSVADIQAIALEEDSGADLAAGSFRVRFVHAALQIPPVNVINIPAQGALTPVWEDVAFGHDGGYIDLPAGSYTLGVDVDDDHSPELAFALGHIPAGTIANAFAVNNGGTVHLVLQPQ